MMQSPTRLPPVRVTVASTPKNAILSIREYNIISDTYKKSITPKIDPASLVPLDSQSLELAVMQTEESAFNTNKELVSQWDNYLKTNYPEEWTRAQLIAKEQKEKRHGWNLVKTMLSKSGLVIGAAAVGGAGLYGAGLALGGAGAAGAAGEGAIFVTEATGVSTGAEAGAFAAYDAALAEGAAAGVGSTAGTGSVFGAAEFAAYDAALAEGAAAGVGSTAGTTLAGTGAIATGAGTVVSTLKGASDILGIGAAIKGIVGAVGGAVLKDRISSIVNDVFGGGGQPGAAGAGGAGAGGFESGEGGKFNYLPYLFIGLTLFGAFLLSRKGR